MDKKIYQERWKYSRFFGAKQLTPVLTEHPHDVWLKKAHHDIVLQNGSPLYFSSRKGLELSIREYNSIDENKEYPEDVRGMQKKYIHCEVTPSYNEQGYQQPLLILHEFDLKGKAGILLPRLSLHVHEGVKVTIVIEREEKDEFQNVSLEEYNIHLGKNAQCTVYDMGGDFNSGTTNIFSHVHVYQGEGSIFIHRTFDTSFASVRNEVIVEQIGSHATSIVEGMIYGRSESAHEYFTHIEHRGHEGISKQEYRFAQDDSSKGVLQANITVPKGIQGTEAHQLAKGLLVSDSSRLDMKPRLEIETDDVVCSHGVAIGNLDEDALFFLRSRGIGEVNAKDILLTGFLLELLMRTSEDYVKKKILDRFHTLFPLK